ncbi:MAG: hypothetical protein JNJ54_12900 [Myxococcaceae bacterium]|nr:hypothetical protein [Myxococcaceae bacterium]
MRTPRPILLLSSLAAFALVTAALARVLFMTLFDGSPGTGDELPSVWATSHLWDVVEPRMFWWMLAGAAPSFVVFAILVLVSRRVPEALAATPLAAITGPALATIVTLTAEQGRSRTIMETTGGLNGALVVLNIESGLIFVGFGILTSVVLAGFLATTLLTLSSSLRRTALVTLGVWAALLFLCGAFTVDRLETSAMASAALHIGPGDKAYFVRPLAEVWVAASSLVPVLTAALFALMVTGALLAPNRKVFVALAFAACLAEARWVDWKLAPSGPAVDFILREVPVPRLLVAPGSATGTPRLVLQEHLTRASDGQPVQLSREALADEASWPVLTGGRIPTGFVVVGLGERATPASLMVLGRQSRAAGVRGLALVTQASADHPGARLSSWLQPLAAHFALAPVVLVDEDECGESCQATRGTVQATGVATPDGLLPFIGEGEDSYDLAARLEVVALDAGEVKLLDLHRAARTTASRGRWLALIIPK